MERSKLVLLRHGESEWNNKNVFCGWIDVSLTAKGEQQAIEAAQMMKEHNLVPDILFTSRLIRACDTGYLVTKSLRRQWIDVHRSWRLNERHYGALQGRKKEDVVKEVGKKQYMFWRRAYEGCPPLISDTVAKDEKYAGIETPRGESLRMVLERVKPYYEEYIVPELARGKTVFVSCHGTVVRSLMKIIMDISVAEIEKINIPNGVPFVIEGGTKKGYYLDEEKALRGAKEVASQGLGATGAKQQNI